MWEVPFVTERNHTFFFLSTLNRTISIMIRTIIVSYSLPRRERKGREWRDKGQNAVSLSGRLTSSVVSSWGKIRSGARAVVRQHGRQTVLDVSWRDTCDDRKAWYVKKTHTVQKIFIVTFAGIFAIALCVLFSHLSFAFSNRPSLLMQGQHLQPAQRWFPAWCPRSQWCSCSRRKPRCPHHKLLHSLTPTVAAQMVYSWWLQLIGMIGDLKEKPLTLTGNPVGGITTPLGILQVSSFNRTWALQSTPPMVITVSMQLLTVFSLRCCDSERGQNKFVLCIR